MRARKWDPPDRSSFAKYSYLCTSLVYNQFLGEHNISSLKLPLYDYSTRRYWLLYCDFKIQNQKKRKRDEKWSFQNATILTVWKIENLGALLGLSVANYIISCRLLYTWYEPNRKVIFKCIKRCLLFMLYTFLASNNLLLVRFKLIFCILHAYNTYYV